MGQLTPRVTTLRVLLASVPMAGQEVAWALVDADGRCSRQGRSVPSQLPSADRVEAVVAAAQVRIAVITLPPMAPARLRDAARFALEDQLAVPVDALHLAVSTRGANGEVRVVIVDRALLQAIAAGDASLPRPARIVAEPDLAPAGPAWRWCAAGGNAGFVRCADGSAFAVDAPGADGALPPGLALALGQAMRERALPSEVTVEAPCTDAMLARWQRETGVAFRRGAPWQWHAASATASASALDLSPVARVAESSVVPTRRTGAFAIALGIAAAALTLHVLATIADWAWLRLDARRTARALATLAAEAGVPQEVATDPASAWAAIARRHAEARHAHGLTAPDDALPLLARAAPALAVLPSGSVRSLSYASGHWTLDLAPADPAMLADLDARLREAGVPALTASGTNGARVRLGAR